MKHMMNVARAAAVVLIASVASASSAMAESTDVVADAPRWRPDSLAMNVLATVIFAVVGIVLAVGGFKLFDLVTPGKLQEEICEKQNLAAGILGAAVILGISIIIAAAVY